MSLHLYPRLTQNTTGLVFLGDLDIVARDWRRSSRAIGGYWLGSFELSQEDLTRGELVEFYNLNIGCRLIETTFGLLSWEGYIIEMRLCQDEAEFMQSLDPDQFHNRVNVVYSDATNERQETDWSENTDSSDIFGECNVIISLGGCNSTAAGARQDRELAEFAWPRSREVGGDSFGGAAGRSNPDRLDVTVAGYWHTLGWRYRETTISDAASDIVDTLVSASEFVTAGSIETNSDSMRVDCYPNARLLSDIIEEVIEQGDSSGNIWQGGVYEDREFVYEQAPIAWEYQKRGSELLDRAGNPVPLSLIKPGFLLYNASAPTGWARPGTASDWDDPRIRYVEEVEFRAGERGGYDELRCRYSDVEEGVGPLEARIRRGNI